MEGRCIHFALYQETRGDKKMDEKGVIRHGLRNLLHMDGRIYLGFNGSSILGMLYTICWEDRECLCGVIPFLL